MDAATCANCHGTWISTAALERRARLETMPDQPHLQLAPLTDLASTVATSDSTAPLPCPDCRQIMQKGRFHPKIPVQIDTCERCNEIWLDAGEQGLLLKLYREFVAAQREQITGQQQNIDRLHQAQSQRPAGQTYSSADNYSSGASSTDAADATANIAINVGCAVFNILIDLLLSSNRSSHSRW